jgi:hypothetical protein
VVAVAVAIGALDEPVKTDEPVNTLDASVCTLLARKMLARGGATAGDAIYTRSIMT